MNKIIFDAGATKLEYTVYGDQKITKKIFGCYNFVKNQEAINQMIKIAQMNSCDIILIGLAGYTAFDPEILKKYQDLKIEVISDIELFARVYLKSDKHLLGMLGTGSVFIRQKEKMEIIGGYGNIFEEVGSGTYYGKKVISKFLNDCEINKVEEYISVIMKDFNLTSERDILKLIYDNELSVSELSTKYFSHPLFTNFQIEFITDLHNLLEEYKLKFKVEKIFLSGSISTISSVKESLKQLPYVEVIENGNLTERF